MCIKDYPSLQLYPGEVTSVWNGSFWGKVDLSYRDAQPGQCFHVIPYEIKTQQICPSKCFEIARAMDT
jgi:hypothetical protein